MGLSFWFALLPFFPASAAGPTPRKVLKNGPLSVGLA